MERKNRRKLEDEVFVLSEGLPKDLRLQPEKGKIVSAEYKHYQYFDESSRNLVLEMKIGDNRYLSKAITNEEQISQFLRYMGALTMGPSSLLGTDVTVYTRGSDVYAVRRR